MVPFNKWAGYFDCYLKLQAVKHGMERRGGTCPAGMLVLRDV